MGSFLLAFLTQGGTVLASTGAAGKVIRGVASEGVGHVPRRVGAARRAALAGRGDGPCQRVGRTPPPAAANGRLPRAAAREFFRPFELCVFGGGLPTAFRQTLLARSLRTPQAAVLTCPPAWRPLSRVLVLNHRRRPGDAFLDTVASLCRTFQVVPVVLTVGRTESAARTWELRRGRGVRRPRPGRRFRPDGGLRRADGRGPRRPLAALLPRLRGTAPPPPGAVGCAVM